MTYQTFSDHFNNAPMTPSQETTDDKNKDSYFTTTSVAADTTAATPSSSTPAQAEFINPHIGNLIQEEKERYHKSTDNLHVSL